LQNYPAKNIEHCMSTPPTGRPATEIAFASGFNSSQYFATRFRQRFQISPSRFIASLDSSKV